jgi:hypothetical protein
MEGRTMFDLEKKINDWKNNLLGTGSMLESDVQELESHLRDQITDLLQSGLSEKEAFWVAQNRMGNTDGIRTEFKKVNGNGLWRERLLWIGTGIIGLYIFMYGTSLLGNLFFMLGSFMDIGINLIVTLVTTIKGLAYVSLFIGVLSILKQKKNIYVKMLKNVFGHMRKHILAYGIGFMIIFILNIVFRPLMARLVEIQEYSFYVMYSQIFYISSVIIVVILMIIFAVKVRKRAVA